MPALDRINTTYERAGLVVLGVSVDEDLRRAREFADSMKVSYPIMFDTGSDIGRDYLIAEDAHDHPGGSLGRGALLRIVGYKRGDERLYLDHIRELLRE